MTRIGKKPCPSGEQIINGGFETGDFTGWECLDGEVQTTTVHGGVYAARVYPSGTRRLRQTLATAVLVACVTSFGLWYQQASDSSYVVILYTDGSDATFYLTATGAWTYFDFVVAGLDAGKSIERISIYSGTGASLYVDDVSMIC